MTILFLAVLLAAGSANAQPIREISETQLRDKLHGYWIGQLAGNYVGFPFENLYEEEPIPILIDRYFTFRDANEFKLKMNLNDRRAYTNIMADAMGGAWSDDDTDIEFVTLHAIEKYGHDFTYEQLAEMWTKHINRFIWSAAREARDLMDEGLVPPETGDREHNRYWYRITSQLTTEIWGAINPGMADRAARRAEWNARVCTDEWATHPDIIYASLYSAAFFESDPEKLVRGSLKQIPANSPFHRGITDLLQWHTQHKDWRTTRQLMHDKYFHEIDGFRPEYPVGGAIINGLSGVMAILYGDGDILKTIGIATSAGYDCDNQAATCGGLLGIIHGASAFPESLTRELPARGRWQEPFNDTYINYSRDELPNRVTITEIVDRLLAVTEKSVLAAGGTVETRNGEKFYAIHSDSGGRSGITSPLSGREH